MAQSVIGALRVNLGLDSAQFQRGARRARNPINQLRSQFLRVASAATAMGAALSLAVRSGLRDVDRVAKAARTIDGTTGALRALELAAGDAGVSQSDVTNAAQRMTREIARAAREGGRGADALGRLGLEASALAEMDADERLATIADRIRELGLSSGDTMDLLRDLGVRSEEMALLMTQGGGAIRAARREVDELGLALDDQAVRQIERTNDSLQRIGLAFQAFRNRLAASVAPALESLSNSFVDAMREGGALRRVLDGLADNLQRIITYVGTAVAFFGARYVAALVAARVATMSLSGALVVLRGALIRTGVGALVVGAGELVYQFGRLSSAAGSVGEAVSLMGDVVREVFSRISDGISYLGDSFVALGRGMKASFLDALRSMTGAFVDFTQNIARGINDLFGTNLQGLSQEITQEITGAFMAARRGAEDAAAGAQSAWDSFTAPLESLGALRSALKDTEAGTDEARTAAERYNEELEKIAGGGGGGGSGGGAAGRASKGLSALAEQAKRATEDVGQSVNSFSQYANTLASGFSNAFLALTDSTRSATEALGQMLQQLASMAANSAFQSLFGGLLGGLFGGGSSPMSFTGWAGAGSVPVPSFAGGGFTGTGARSGGMDGHGGFPAILHPNETVIDHTRGGGGTTVQVVNNTGAPVREERSRGPDGREIIRAIIGEEIGSGRMDKPMGRFGLSPAKVRR